ncbi:MAG: YebC/PmpR family DNA-binding transcriptional regulator [Candidatus Gracilibacteria bacterium]|nr:YebC/PmpR family DNA-binding transcriptional regulator [Candidatus Gracilibacteria bacterium]
MGRGPVVQARKNAVNAVKGKIFSLHAKLITIAAQKGGDPDGNPSLFAAIHKAKKEGVPNENIDRAIKKGTGEDKSAAQIVEIVYEGYAPGGVAIMVSVLTDNKNRTVANIRHIFTKYGGTMGESGAVSWMFHRKGVIFIDTSKHSFDQIEELIYDTNAEDIISEESYIKIITAIEDFNDVEKYLEGKGIEIMEAKLDFVADNEVEVTEFDKALKFIKMMESFHEDEDVNTLSSNELISDELTKEVEEFIEKNTFRT